MAKIIFIDVDGTLVDYENKLPPSAAVAIKSARKAGHRVYISTGRSKAEIYPYIWDIGLDGMIGGNGSYVEDSGEVILHRLITEEQTKRIVDYLHQKGLEFYLESNSGLYASERFENAAEGAIREYSKRKGKGENLTVREAFPEMIFGGNLYRSDLNKVSYLLGSYNDYLETAKEFPDMQNGTWGGKGEEALFGDIGVKGISKASAIEALLKHLGAEQKDTIAFGDAKIDIPMLEYCATGVAMGSGGEEIKAMAAYVTDDVDKDGLYKAFEHFNLLG